MKYQIEGITMQTLILHLNRGEQVYSETGSLLMMSSGARMTTTGGGLGSMLARGLSGNSLFLNVFEAESDDEQVMFATRMPGHIVPFDMEQAYEIGGDGLYLIRLTGPGHVWLHGVSIHNLREVIATPGAR